jgi:hypothetical protein
MHPIIRQALKDQRTGDAWADTVSPLFDLAETIHVLGFRVPTALEFRPAAGLTIERIRDNSEERDFANLMLDAIDDNAISVSDLQDAALTLNRLCDILRAQGKD